SNVAERLVVGDLKFAATNDGAAPLGVGAGKDKPAFADLHHAAFAGKGAGDGQQPAVGIEHGPAGADCSVVGEFEIRIGAGAQRAAVEVERAIGDRGDGAADLKHTAIKIDGAVAA